ncbi:MAG TPA: metallophosphoesterase family protein [Pyrinomonadaceae bacterium]|nr:metallophosphoesterase family protein [Pyrinomonadaceae bacterium]
MRTLVHISDIHFGRVDYAIAESIIIKINEIAPDLVVVSGDLTQRARSAQFIEAKAFLDKLPKPQIVVPGNHDIPLHNVYDRFLHPLDKYKKYITDDLEPFYADEEIAVLGINTARSLTIKDGRVNEEQVALIQERLCGLPQEILKILVTHHPFDLPAGYDNDQIVGRAEMAMREITDCGADIFLAGHIHVSHIGHTATRYKLGAGRNALVVQAGTATSTRGRGEANSFNLIEFEHPRLIVKRLECISAETGFVLAETQEFLQGEKGWARN